VREWGLPSDFLTLVIITIIIQLSHSLLEPVLFEDVAELLGGGAFLGEGALRGQLHRHGGRR